MNREEIEEYCKMKIGAKVYFYQEWEAIRADIENKLFVMITHNKEGVPIVTVKLPPEEGELYRKQYEDVVPGYYMNKQHWNSVYYEKGTVSEKIIKEMIDTSYQLVFESLSKKLKSKYEN